MDPGGLEPPFSQCHCGVLPLDDGPERFGGVFGMLEDRFITGLGVIHPTPRELLPAAIKFAEGV